MSRREWNSSVEIGGSRWNRVQSNENSESRSKRATFRKFSGILRETRRDSIAIQRYHCHRKRETRETWSNRGVVRVTLKGVASPKLQVGWLCSPCSSKIGARFAFAGNRYKFSPLNSIGRRSLIAPATSWKRVSFKRGPPWKNRRPL